MIYLKAQAIVKGLEKFKDLSGKVIFYQRQDGVLVEAHISKLPKNDTGFFGFHIHEGTNCEGENFENTLSHYNPKSKEHPKHAGDFPPILSYNSNAYMQFITDRFSVDEIISKTVVIHFGADDFTS